MRTWREQLDARIDACPGCDQWRFDQHCTTCNETIFTEKEAA